MYLRFNLTLFCAASIWLLASVASGHAQGTAFTYQGQLMNNGQVANGNYDIIFTLFRTNQAGSATAPGQTNLNTPVSNGLFQVMLNFGAVFNGSNYWLELAVRTNGNGAFTTLEPRQFLSPIPYAIYSANASNASSADSAASVPAAGIIGTIPVNNLNSNVALLSNGTIPTNLLPSNLATLGGLTWQAASATTVQAQPNTAYILTNSQTVTVTLPSAPNIGDVVKIAGAGAGGWILAQNAGQTIAATFNPVLLPGDASGSWASIATSADGSKLAAVDNSGGGIWISTNFGTNWSQTSAPSDIAQWQSIASSSDGTRLAAVDNAGNGIWVSRDSGTTWTQTPAPTDPSWNSIAASTDGARLAAVDDTGGIWTSPDGGKDWTETSASTNASWFAIASSSNGSKLAAVDNGGGGIWTSTNFGTNWTQTSAPTDPSWNSIASSADGTKLAAVDAGGGIWTSPDSGTSWALTTAPTNSTWYSIASSTNGAKLAAVINGGAIWISTNFGTNWTQTTTSSPALESAITSLGWTCVASSSDGTKLAAGTDSGPILTFVNGVVNQQSASISGATESGPAGYLSGTFGTVVELVYAGSGQFIALYQTGTLTGH
jgi:photosystem II stability/assembly factor-like uncharacterized protein